MAPSSVLELTAQRRSGVRFRLRLPVIFHWTDGTEHTEGGFTYDVSLDGALILSSRCPPVGASIRIQVLIPALGNSTEEVRIECVGTVTRVTRQPASFGVSGKFDYAQLTRETLM
ncbi:MAG: PilZ domain-containing protein [Acidobacteriaceae bacterium]